MGECAGENCVQCLKESVTRLRSRMADAWLMLVEGQHQASRSLLLWVLEGEPERGDVAPTPIRDAMVVRGGEMPHD